MSTQQMLEQLRAPFPADAIHWRVGATSKDKTSGIALAYLDARDVMRRLDEVCGPFWQAEYPFEGCCRIGIKLDGEWLWRSNGAGETDVEGEKGRFSDAFKRAAVLWGVGRYLYALPNTWVPLKPQGRSYAIAQPPQLPAWALPSITEEQVEQLHSALQVAGTDVKKWLGYYRISSVRDLPPHQFAGAMELLKKKAQAQEAQA